MYAAGFRYGADAAGDLNLIYAYAKVMDPNSVVREGEQASVAGGDTWINQKTAQLQKQLGQGGTFKPEFRTRLREEMAGRMGELNQLYIADRVRYKQIADRNGVDVRDVVGDHPGARYQALSGRVLGKKQQQLDYNGLPIATGPTKMQRNPEVEALAGSLIRGGLPYEQVNNCCRQNGASGDIDRQQFDTMREAIAQGYQGPAADTAQEVASTAWNRFSGSDLGIGLQAGLDAGFAGLTDEMAGTVQSALNGKPISENIAALDQAKRAAFNQSPNAAMLGQFGGSLGGVMALGGAMKAAGLAGKLALPELAADIAYGGLSGAGQANDNRLIGAAGGSLASAAGGAAW
ncbi:hypothetical protein AB5I41_01425 [Sphingomonas sp. MMS24-JH45]